MRLLRNPGVVRLWSLAVAAGLAWCSLPAPVCAQTLSHARSAAASLDAGEYFACGLFEGGMLNGTLESGTLKCWGENAAGQALPPQGYYLSVSAGFDHACALRGDGQPICWGNPAGVSSSPPVGPYVALSAGQGENCGLRSDGQLRCWGGAMSAAAPTTGTFIAVSVSPGRGCAIRSDGALQCWQAAGVASLGTVPTGRYFALSLGSSHACALRSDGKVQCWGSNAQGQTSAPTAPNFVAVASGYQHACGIEDNGSIVCWGSNAAGQRNAPAGRFDAISAGRLHTCARNEEGSIQCWGGTGAQGELDPPTYNFQALAVGPDQACGLVYEGNYGCVGATSTLTPVVRGYDALSFGTSSACGLTVDGLPLCWGAPLGTPPNEPMTAISVGSTHVCALRLNGGAACWGDNSFGEATPPPQVDYQAFSTIASGDRFTCGLSGYAGLVCWGQGLGVTDAPQGLFRALSVHAGNACVLDNSGYASCWGSNAALLQPPSNQTFAAIAVGARHVCAIGTTSDPFSSGPMQCWGDGSQGQLLAPTGTGYFRMAAFGDTTCVADLEQMRCWGSQTSTKASPTVLAAAAGIAAGEAHSCTVRGNRGVGCWGDAALGQRNVPIHRARSVSANGDHSCSLRGDGQTVCWGDNTHAASTPPVGASRGLDIGQFNGCTVGANGSAGCWGWNVNGQNTPPAGPFRSVATGLNHSCGVRDDGTIACWGYNADGQATAPAGVFSEVDVGERHSCAIAANGGLQCWGLGTEGQTTLPDLPGASYRALAVGAFHNCAIVSLGSIACWGRNDRGQATPPEEGVFVSIAAGAAHTCAVRDDGVRLCWGANEQGQAPQLSIGPATLPQAIADADYRLDLILVGTGGYVPVAPRFQFVSGELPPGIGMNVYGQLVGRPYLEGTYTLNLRGHDENGLQAEREIQITVLPPRPQIEVLVDGVHRNGSGWYSSDVHVTWTITPLGAGLTTSGCDAVTVDYDTPAVEFHCVATNSSGTTERTVSLRRDATPPQTLLLQVPPTQNNYGVEEQPFTFESVGPDLSGHAGFECNPTQYESEYSYYDCVSPYVLPAGTFPGYPGTYTMRVRAKDAAGNVDPTPATFTWTVLQDTSVPVIVPNIVGTAGDNGWYLDDVRLTWSVSDPQTPLRDVVGCEPFTLNVEGSIAQYCEAKSWAGRAQAAVVLRRDTVAPAIIAAPTAAPNGSAGWYTVPVTVAHSCMDATSGLAIGCPPAQELTQEGSAISSTAKTTRDIAGNSATSNVVTVKIDRTFPTIVPRYTSQPNNNGWYNHDVVIEFDCADAVSGIQPGDCPISLTLSDEGANVTRTVPVHDVAGLQSTTTVVVNIDKTAPVITSIPLPTTVLLNGQYTVTPVANDPISGVVSAACTPLDTQTVGQKTVTCNATDRAGNMASRTATYRVVYDFVPLSAPMSNPGQLYLVEAPRSVPFEWRVRDANGVAITNATLTQTIVTEVSCPNTGVPLPTPPAGETNTFENFGDGRYRRNWWINPTNPISCVRLDVVLNDGITRSATIRIVPKIRRTGGPGQPQVATPAARSAPSSQPVATPRSVPMPARHPVKTRRAVQGSVKSRAR
ncbi:MAG: PxKF domain-containing protein [Lysobacteraceae bacterium]